MNYYDYRQKAAAQWFLSSISLDGKCFGGSKALRCYRDGKRVHGFLALDDEDEEGDKSDLEHPIREKDSTVSERCGVKKSVCFDDDIFYERANSPVVPNGDFSGQRLPSHPHHRLASTPHGASQNDRSFDHYYRYTISTMSMRRPPLVVASVIPLSRDPLMLSGIPKGQSAAQSVNEASGGGGGGRQRPVPEMHAAIFNSLFRHSENTPSTSLALEESTAFPSVAKPLSCAKPVDSTDRSYVHFLAPRKPAVSTGQRQRAETVGGDFEASQELTTDAEGSEKTGRNHQQRQWIRSQTLSLSSVEKSSNGVKPAAYGFHSVDSTAYLSSSENVETIQPEVYDDPLVNYNPLLLDDPLVLRVTNRRVFPFQGYVISILGYRRADEHKKNINREFHQRFPNVQLTLTKMRSIKLNLLAIALRMNLDLWIVAHAYVLFEKMILKLFVCKSNRKLCAGAALLISAKLNDLKGPVMHAFLQEIENEFRISRRDLLHMEMAAFIGLEFCVLPSPAEVQPHFAQIQKSLGTISAPRCVPSRSRSVEDEPRRRTSILLE